MVKLTNEQLEKRRKTNKKIFSIFGIIFAVFIVIGIINSLTGKDNEKMVGTKSEKTVATNYALDPMLIEFKDDADIHEWIEIKERSTPFKKDKKWIKDTFVYLREANKKWDVVKDKEILMRIDAVYGGRPDIIKFKSDEDLYEEYEKQLDMLLQRFRNKIVKNVVYKNMVSFPIPFEEFDNLASSYGFAAVIKDKGWYGFPVYKYYKDYSSRGGKMKGKGQYFKASVNQDESIVDIDIPFGEGEFDPTSFGRDPAADDKMFRNFIKEHLSNPPVWIPSSLNLIFGPDAQTVANKIAEIGKADDAKLKEMYSDDDFKGFDMWFTSLSIGGKNITVKHFAGTTTMSVKMDETHRLWNMYNSISLKKVL